MLLLVHQLFSLVPITVNLTQIIFIWHMQILWQRWVQKILGMRFEVVPNIIRKCSCFFFSFPLHFLELPYWWGRRRGRGNVGKCWGWDVLWGATVRTGNGRPGARDQEHNGAVALNALSDLIIGTLFHNHISLSVFIMSHYLYLFCQSPVSSVCMLCFIHCELPKPQSRCFLLYQLLYVPSFCLSFHNFLITPRTKTYCSPLVTCKECLLVTHSTLP